MFGLQCLPLLQAHPYLLEEEDTYEPPEDPDSGTSIFSFRRRLEFTLTSHQAFLSKSLVQELWNGCLAIVPSTVSMLSTTCGTSSCYGSRLISDVIIRSSDHLLECLRPFAQQGKIVEEADVTRFFEALKEKRQQFN